MMSPINLLFGRLDSLMLDLQEMLCAAQKTHRADQVDILRRAMRTVQEMASADKRRKS